MKRDALISACGRYRYWLLREWAASERMPVLWMMLNPSTADAQQDDATIRRCIEFSKRWGYGSLLVVNLFAFRSTYPKDLFTVSWSDAKGPENDGWIARHCGQTSKGIVAWGNGGYYPRPQLPTHPGGWWHLGKTANGEPKHPLARGKSFIPYEQPLAAFR